MVVVSLSGHGCMQADHAKSKKMIWKRDTVRKCRARRSSSHGCYVLSVDATVDAIPGVGDMIFPEHTHMQDDETRLDSLCNTQHCQHVEIQHSDITRGRMDVNSIGSIHFSCLLWFLTHAQSHTR